jgi:transcriptional regulator with XRE-family HTH domain
MYVEIATPNMQGQRQLTTFESVGTKAKAIVAISICTYMVGTMGVITPEVLALRDITTPGVQYRHPEKTNPPPKAAAKAIADVNLEPSPGQNLARIREILNPTVLELANLFGVSRQAVYDWQAGAQPNPETGFRLAELARAADVFANADLRVNTQTLRRKVAGGPTLLNAIFTKGNAVQVAQSLVETLQRENSQREHIAQQLASRKRGPVNPADYGAPSLNEES